MSVEAIGLLHEPVRRAVYEFAAAQAEPVGRNEVAEAVGIGRTLAAFHLDKLAAAGLLEVSYARRSGRAGPGAGRPAKLYRRAATEHSVSVPPRGYRALAEMLAEALDEVGGDAVAHAAAHRRGRAAAAAIAAGAAPEPAGGAPAGVGVAGVGVAGVVALLAGLGYEPSVDGAEIRLRNCPFGTVAHAFPPLVCGMNLSVIRGALTGIGIPEDRARIDPRPEGCCVVVTLDQQ